jgi:hypothetical protein
MQIRAIFAPLLSGSTYRSGVHLLLGGVIALPYVLLAATFVQMLQEPDTPRAVALILLGVALVIACLPAFLRGTRTMETVAARALLDVDLPVQAARNPTVEARLRSALWFAIHLIAGGAFGAALMAALPMALALITQVGVGTELLDHVRGEGRQVRIRPAVRVGLGQQPGQLAPDVVTGRQLSDLSSPGLEPTLAADPWRASDLQMNVRRPHRDPYPVDLEATLERGPR